MADTNLELTIRRLPDGAYAADLHAVLANADAELARDVRLALDQQALREASFDGPQAYGRLLREMLFTPDLRVAWAQALGYHQRGSDSLRVRLRLDPADDALHGLYWEMLYAPDAEAPLALGERVLFSRYLGSPDLADIQAPQRPDLKALVVVANPADLETFRLQPVDVDGEVRRARLALGDIPTTILAHAAGGKRVTLPNIAAALREGPHILYLVCHGTLQQGSEIRG